jgi:hypothetical protein
MVVEVSCHMSVERGEDAQIPSKIQWQNSRTMNTLLKAVVGRGSEL